MGGGEDEDSMCKKMELLKKVRLLRTSKEYGEKDLGYLFFLVDRNAFSFYRNCIGTEREYNLFSNETNYSCRWYTFPRLVIFQIPTIE